MVFEGNGAIATRTDKNWSLTDCIGMVAAESYRVDSIFTSDHHSQQAGFKILL